jgi:hypothetical protein
MQFEKLTPQYSKQAHCTYELKNVLTRRRKIYILLEPAQSDRPKLDRVL